MADPDIREVEVAISMPKIPGVSRRRPVRALENAGFVVVRQGNHIVMARDEPVITLPRHDPIDAYTMGGIVQDARLTIHEFKQLLRSAHSSPKPA